MSPIDRCPLALVEACERSMDIDLHHTKSRLKEMEQSSSHTIIGSRHSIWFFTSDGKELDKWYSSVGRVPAVTIATCITLVWVLCQDVNPI
jgi:hypothetical protein